MLATQYLTVDHVDWIRKSEKAKFKVPWRKEFNTHYEYLMCKDDY
jgi:hypothetical protein